VGVWVAVAVCVGVAVAVGIGVLVGLVVVVATTAARVGVAGRGIGVPHAEKRAITRIVKSGA
jgi:hypothetical protein